MAVKGANTEGESISLEDMKRLRRVVDEALTGQTSTPFPIALSSSVIARLPTTGGGWSSKAAQSEAVISLGEEKYSGGEGQEAETVQSEGGSLQPPGNPPHPRALRHPHTHRTTPPLTVCLL